MAAEGGAGESNRTVRVTGTLSNKAEVMEAFSEALTLPDWFGRNWDALADALGECDDTVVIIEEWGSAPPDVAATLRDVIDAATELAWSGPDVYAVVDDELDVAVIDDVES